MSAASLGSDDFEDEGGVISDINVTPMVDIMLVLLIIFMVTASLIVSPSLKVELPKGSAKPQQLQQDEQRDVVVTVTRTGELQFKNRALSTTDLLTALSSEHRARPKARLLVLADKKAYHANVVKVMDVARTVGFQRLGIAIDPRAGEVPKAAP